MGRGEFPRRSRKNKAGAESPDSGPALGCGDKGPGHGPAPPVGGEGQVRGQVSHQSHLLRLLTLPATRPRMSPWRIGEYYGSIL